MSALDAKTKYQLWGLAEKSWESAEIIFADTGIENAEYDLSSIIPDLNGDAEYVFDLRQKAREHYNKLHQKGVTTFEAASLMMTGDANNGLRDYDDPHGLDFTRIAEYQRAAGVPGRIKNAHRELCAEVHKVKESGYDRYNLCPRVHFTAKDIRLLYVDAAFSNVDIETGMIIVVIRAEGVMAWLQHEKITDKYFSPEWLAISDKSNTTNNETIKTNPPINPAPEPAVLPLNKPKGESKKQRGIVPPRAWEGLNFFKGDVLYKADENAYLVYYTDKLEDIGISKTQGRVYFMRNICEFDDRKLTNKEIADRLNCKVDNIAKLYKSASGKIEIQNTRTDIQRQRGMKP